MTGALVPLENEHIVAGAPTIGGCESRSTFGTTQWMIAPVWPDEEEDWSNQQWCVGSGLNELLLQWLL